MSRPAARTSEATGAAGVTGRELVFRVLGTLTVGLGAAYLAWRCAFSLNDRALWFAIPLLAAELYAFVGTVLFVLTMWRPTHRVAPPPLDDGTVDVFITTYNEPVDLVRMTVQAALRIDWPALKVWVLDDGARAKMQVMARELGAGYITRGEEWTGKPRHAKAGNINNALTLTDGAYLLVLDADQIPDRRIVRQTIGYFRDPELAFVQTPQRFYNLPPGDPFGADAPLFYGPILQGKDGWDAAFYCGSNALLRREALLELGVTEYVRDMEAHFARALRTLRRGLSGRATRNLPAARLLLSSLRSANDALRAGAPLERVSDMVREAVAAARAGCDHPDVLSMTCHLEQLVSAAGADGSSHGGAVHGEGAALQLEEEALREVSLTRPEEAQPVLPLATISVTEDMATAMRLHALGWKSAFHPEVLAWGLAPEDLRSALAQRRRWAQGTIQVLLRENPLFVRGLSLPQRLQYFATMLTYFDGFASLVFLLSPVVSLLTGLAPVRTPWLVYLAWLVPYLAVNRLMYLYAAHGIRIRRSEQFSLALFPLWIEAVVRTLLQRQVDFVVTPKRRQGGDHLGLVWPQLVVISMTGVAIVYGVLAFVLRGQGTVAGVATNVFWGGYGMAMLLPIVRAAIFRPPEGWSPRPPDFLLGEATR
jgi:cellulose synthase (UDP-forming)